MKITLGEQIKILRGRAKLNQTELAKEAGISRSTLSAIEQDTANFSLLVLQSVAIALGQTLEIRLLSQPQEALQ